MTFAFIVYYRFVKMDAEKASKAKEFWREFVKNNWPEELTIVGDYRYAWGTEWNGFLVLESKEPRLFFDFWPRFREKTRWYLDNTRTIIGVKRDPIEWLQDT